MAEIIQINIKDLDPYTYYRSLKQNRGFLLVDIRPGESWGNNVVLIEFTKTRHEPIFKAIPEFIDLINSGELEKFTPKAI